MPPLSFDACLAHIDAQSLALAAAAAAAAASAQVPSCPDWTVWDLVEHHGQVLRGWAGACRLADPSSPPPWMTGGPRTWAGPDDDLFGWYDASRETLLRTLLDVGPQGPAWTWWGEPATAGAIARHQVQEACVHRWDAQSAAGQAGDALPGDAAADGVAEFLTVPLVADAPTWTGPDTTVLLVPDTGSPWLLRGGEGAITATPADPAASADAVITSSASDMVLLLYSRIAATSLSLIGDEAAAVRLLTDAGA